MVVYEHYREEYANSMIISRGNLMLAVPFLLGLVTWVLIKIAVLSGLFLFAAQLLLFFSVIILIWEGSDLLVNSSQEIAEHFQVSPFLIGLTVVAFGTSVPEMVTTLVAGLGGKGDIAVANVVGSNILNTSVILGGLALLTKGGLAINRQTVRLDAPILILGTFLILLFIGQPPIESHILDKIKHYGLLNLKLDIVEAIVLVTCFILYLFVVLTKRGNMAESPTQQTSNIDLSSHETAKKIEVNNSCQKTLLSKCIRVSAGLIIVMIGCHVLVGETKVVEGVTSGYGAVWFASVFGIPDYLIGLSIVALGTSAPEIVVSLSAARNGSVDIGVGNLLGSAIFNLFAVLGLAGLFIQPPLAESITIGTGAIQSLIAMGLLFVMVLFFLATSRRLSRKEGFVLFCTGAAYMIYEMVNAMTQNSL